MNTYMTIIDEQHICTYFVVVLNAGNTIILKAITSTDTTIAAIAAAVLPSINSIIPAIITAALTIIAAMRPI